MLHLIRVEKKTNLRALAGDIIHEGLGHRAISVAASRKNVGISGRTYHNPKNKGVMSEKIRQTAGFKDILFKGKEVDKVNKHLKFIMDNPDWNK